MNNHSVYEHLDSKGRQFYIGRGQNKRPWSTDSRNEDWWDSACVDNVVCFTVVIVAEHLSHEEAKVYERSYIEAYGLEALANRIH